MLLQSTEHLLMKTSFCQHRRELYWDWQTKEHSSVNRWQQRAIYSELWIAVWMISRGIFSYSMSRIAILLSSPSLTHLMRGKTETCIISRAESTPYNTLWPLTHCKSEEGICRSKSYAPIWFPRKIPLILQKVIATMDWHSRHPCSKNHLWHMSVDEKRRQVRDRILTASYGTGHHMDHIVYDQSWQIGQSRVHLGNNTTLHPSQGRFLCKGQSET